MTDDRRAQVVEEMTSVIAAVASDTTEMWRTGELTGTLVRARVTDDFVGTQYAPWFDGGAFSADREGWLAGTRAAASQYAGKGIRWETDQVVIVPRGPDEAIVSYRVTHIWPDGRAPSVALFLETWVKRDDVWCLRRHTAEKA